MRTYTGAKRKRTATPASRHLRPVAFRHGRRYVRSPLQETLLSVPEAEEERILQTPEEEVTETVPEQEETALVIPQIEEEPEPEQAEQPTEEPADIQEILEESALQDVQPEPEKPAEPKKTVSERLAERKAKRTAAKEAAIEDYINTPRTNVFRKLIRPYAAMVTESSVKETVSEPVFSLAVTVFKFLGAGAWISRITASYINKNAFGYARMSFSGGAWLTLRLAVFLIAAQYILAAAVSAVSYVFRDGVSWKKITASMSQSALSTGCLFVIAALLYGINPALGAGLGIAAAAFGIFMTLSAVARHFDFAKGGRTLIVIAILTALGILGILYVRSACGDIWRIFAAIMNL